jgi:hypothetical protein
MRILPCTSGPRAGMTALEMSIALGMLLLVASTVSQSMRSMQRIQATGEAIAKVQSQGAQAMDEIINDLKNSGFTVQGGLSYPHLFTGGMVAAAYPDEHNHEPATKSTPEYDDAAGPDREILFLRWRDADQNGTPDMDWGSITLLWDVDAPISYTLVTLPGGENVLQRRVTGEAPRIIARYVERFFCEAFGDVGAGLPGATVRVNLWLRVPLEDGSFVSENITTTVRLRNGGNL